MKSIALINDLSGLGGCSLVAGIAVASALGVRCCPLATSVLSNQTEYDSFYCRDMTEDLPKSIAQWERLGASFDAILTGFIPNEKQEEIIGGFIDKFKTEKTIVTVDPVMGDNGSLYDCFTNKMVQAVISLTKKAEIITPNLTELCVLSGEDFEKTDSLPQAEKLGRIEKLCAGLNAKHPVKIVVSGIRLSGDVVANAVYDGGKIDFIENRIQGGRFSGTGDILSAFVAAQSVNGVELKTAVTQAVQFIQAAVSDTIRLSEGKYNPMAGIYFENQLRNIGKYFNKH